MDLTVAVATFGPPEWVALAKQRAIPSAVRLGVPVVHHHGTALDDARNGALAKVKTEWVAYLDADDELEAGYVDAMAASNADIRAPSVRYVQAGRLGPARMPRVAGHTHDCEAACLTAGNWLVIGAAVRASMLRDVGGWRDFTWSEDWSTWLRCHLAGASIEAVPQAVYRAHVRAGSRNRAPSHAAKMEAHRAICVDAGIESPV